ncbi:MAG: hypothetical protein FJZ16_02470 [Candidatus Omnitrophica bacterium]|nr:hypothetical protein [Candidatus Omnitrophota bacterium]
MKIAIVEEIRIRRGVNWEGFVIEVIGLPPADFRTEGYTQQKEMISVWGKTLLIKTLKKLLR